MDIAKEAARLAARAPRGAGFVVADVNAPWPFADASMVALLDIFAPRNPAEAARVLAPGGLLLVVLPAPTHLAELRALAPLMGIERDKRAKVIARLDGPFALESSSALNYAMTLTGEEAANLARMTPSARRTSPGALDLMRGRERIPVSAGFDLLAFRQR